MPDSFEKKQDEQAKLIKSKAKGSSSRLLKEVAVSKDKTKDKKLDALSDLYWALRDSIDKGNMKWNVAIDDFAKGAKDLNK